MPFLTKEKTNWGYILVVVILGLIVVGGILGYLRYFEKEIMVITQIPEIKKLEDRKFANWKIYRNEEYGFEIKYPEDWEIKEEKIGDLSLFYIQKKEENLHTESHTFSFPVSYINIFPGGGEKLIPMPVPYARNTNERKIYLSGKEAHSIQFLTEEGKVWRELIIIENTNLPSKWDFDNWIEIKPKSNLKWECAVPHNTGEECEYWKGRIFTGQVDEYEWKLLNQILSTLKFLK
jgi:hypothetical protein